MLSVTLPTTSGSLTPVYGRVAFMPAATISSSNGLSQVCVCISKSFAPAYSIYKCSLTEPLIFCIPQGSMVTASSTLVFNFGDIVNIPDGVSQGPNDVVIMEIVCVVANDTNNVNGKVLTTSAQLNFSTSSYQKSAVVQYNQNVSVSVVEPKLAITKTMVMLNNVTYVEAGDVVRHTINITHLSGSTSPAYTLNFNDVLLPQFTLVANSVNASVGVVVVGNGTAATVSTTSCCYIVDSQ